jgi:Predicted transcriptional regulators
MIMIYERIRNLREDRDLTQQQLAQLLFVNRRTYSSYETGVRTMSPEILIQLARIHGVSVDYLLGLTDVKTPYPKNHNPAYHKNR